MTRRLPDYVVEVVDRLAPLGPVRPKAMFGGYGLYLDDVFFALVADQLYLKVDDRNRPRFEAAGMEPFRPFEDRPGTMSYYPVPEEVFDDPPSLVDWAKGALDAALRARAAKRRTGR